MLKPFVKRTQDEVHTGFPVRLIKTLTGILKHCNEVLIDAAKGCRGFRPRRGEFEQRHSVVEIIWNSFGEP
jgi:hypothetical protein